MRTQTIIQSKVTLDEAIGAVGTLVVTSCAEELYIFQAVRLRDYAAEIEEKLTGKVSDDKDD